MNPTACWLSVSFKGPRMAANATLASTKNEGGLMSVIILGLIGADILCPSVFTGVDSSLTVNI